MMKTKKFKLQYVGLLVMIVLNFNCEEKKKTIQILFDDNYSIDSFVLFDSHKESGFSTNIEIFNKSGDSILFRVDKSTQNIIGSFVLNNIKNAIKYNKNVFSNKEFVNQEMLLLTPFSKKKVSIHVGIFDNVNFSESIKLNVHIPYHKFGTIYFDSTSTENNGNIKNNLLYYMIDSTSYN